jgi:nicotinamide riboside transporter PnuC
MSHRGSDSTALARRGNAALWFAVMGGPAAWMLGLVVSYFWIHDVCRHHSSMAPRIVSFIALGAAIAAALVGRSIWTQMDRHAPGGVEIPVERTRFLAQIGVLGGSVFSLILFLQIVATLILHPCDERPRTNTSPDVILPSSPAQELAAWF